MKYVITATFKIYKTVEAEDVNTAIRRFECMDLSGFDNFDKSEMIVLNAREKIILGAREI